MRLRSETRENLRTLAEMEQGRITTTSLVAHTGWSQIRSRKVLERLEDGGLLRSELIHVYIEGTRYRNGKTWKTNRRTKVKHYAILEHAYEKMKESEAEAVGTVFAGKPRRIISSVFDLGLHA